MEKAHFSRSRTAVESKKVCPHQVLITKKVANIARRGRGARKIKGLSQCGNSAVGSAGATRDANTTKVNSSQWEARGSPHACTARQGDGTNVYTRAYRVDSCNPHRVQKRDSADSNTGMKITWTNERKAAKYTKQRASAFPFIAQDPFQCPPSESNVQLSFQVANDAVISTELASPCSD